MFEILVPALRASLLLWTLLGLVYPLAVTGLAQMLFPD
jgi:K+-transporting ATPase c subunit